MAKVTFITPPPPPPPPRAVKLELSWDEFCLIRKTVGDQIMSSSLCGDTLLKGTRAITLEAAKNLTALYSTINSAFNSKVK